MTPSDEPLSCGFVHFNTRNPGVLAAILSGAPINPKKLI